MKSFYLKLQDIGFNKINYVNPDNMSCSLGLKGVGAAHTVTWPMEFNGITPPDTIKPVIDIFKDIEKMVSPLRVKHEKKIMAPAYP